MAGTTAELNGSGPFYVALDVSAGGQNIAGNYTRFFWALYIGCWNNGWGTFGGSGAWAVNIAGVEVSGSFSPDFRPSGSSAKRILLANSYIDVPHNADGTRPAFPNYGSIDTSHSSIGDGTTITYIDAPTIPRASWATWAVQDVKYAGTTHQVNFNRASTTFTHKLEYFFGSQSGVIGTGLTDNVNWLIPANLVNEIPNTVTGQGILRTTTYSGATVIGVTDSQFTMTVPLTTVPTLTDITVAETTPGLAASVGGYVQGLSKLALAVVGAAGAGGSTIASYKITIAGQTINAISGTTGPIGSSGAVALQATVTDSRGRTAVRNETVTVLAYTAPVLAAISVQRSSAGGVVSDDGAYFRVNINASVSSLIVGTQKNALKYRISTRVRGTTTWTVKENITPGGITFNSFKTTGTFSVTNAYDVMVEVYDNFSTSAIIITLPVASVFQHWDGPDGVGFGKYREDGRIDSLGDIVVRADPAAGDLGSVFMPVGGNGWVGAEPIHTMGTTAQRNTLFGSPANAAQQAALANRRVRWYNIDLGWEESYFAPTGTAGLTVLGLVATTTPGWYPTGEGPFSKLYANALQSMVTSSYFNTYDTWGVGASARRGGAAHFTYDATQGGVTCLLAGLYEVEGYITRQAGSGEPVCHILRSGNSVYSGIKPLSAGSVSDLLMHVPLVAGPAGAKFTLFNGLGSYQSFVSTGQPEVRGSFVVKYKGPLLSSE